MVSPEVLINILPLSGAVVLATREITEGWDIDSTRSHGPNVVRYEIVIRIHLTALIGDYLPPANMDRLPDLEEALNSFLEKETIVMGT